MRFAVFFLILLFVWFGFIYFLTNPNFLKENQDVIALALPTSWNALGDASGVLNGLFNSVAILIGLITLYMQGRQINESIKQQKMSNEITIKIAKKEFMMRESERLEASIQYLKSKNQFDRALFGNMVKKKQRYMDEANKLANELFGD